MMKWLAVLLLAAAGCSYTFDENAPELPLIGEAPDSPSLPHLNTAPVNDDHFTGGIDGNQWLLMEQNDATVRMVPMSGTMPPDIITQNVDYDQAYFTGSELYLVQNNNPDMGLPDAGASEQAVVGDMGAPPTVTLTVRKPGEHPGQQYVESAGGVALYTGGSGDVVFAYIVLDPRLAGYVIQRRDNGFKRVVPWGKNIDPSNPFAKGGFTFDLSSTGKTFYDWDGDGRLVGHSTFDNSDIDLGIRPHTFGWIDAETIITCGDDGVRRVPVDGVTPESVLTDEVCNPSLFWFNKGFLYYMSGDSARKVPLDGSGPPQEVYDLGDKRLLAVWTPDDTIMYSTDPSTRYVHGVGDGWFVPGDGSPDFKFMNRGSGVSWIDNRTQLYWLENSAQRSGAGELMSLKLPAPATPGGTKVPLARNVRNYGFLADGRIICDDNHAFDGTQNRIIVVDEVRHHSQWVASSAFEESGIPGAADLLIRLVTPDLNGYDLVRAPVPPIIPTPPPNM